MADVKRKRAFPIDVDMAYSKYREFWDKDYSEIFLTMAGIGDVWESPSGNFENSFVGISTIGGIEIYKDKIYIVQGYGMQTIVKVISPQGIEIYGIGPTGILMKSCNRGLQGNLTVLNDDELIVGYMYVNLKRLFSAPYGIDLGSLYGNKYWKISNSRVSSVAWVSGVQDLGGWSIALFKRAAMEDCFDCDIKKKLAAENKAFECEQIDNSFNLHGFSFAKKATRSMIATGVSMSISRMGGLELMDDIKPPSGDGVTCLQAIAKYQKVFKKQKPSASEIGNVGNLISEKCSSYMMRYVVEISSYRESVDQMYENYVEKSIRGDADANEWLIQNSRDVVSLIAPALSDITATAIDNNTIDLLFEDIVWWAPIWFIANPDKVLEGQIGAAYNTARLIDRDNFIKALKNAAMSAPPLPSDSPFKVKWVLASPAGTKPAKFVKNTATFYSFPMGICYSADIIARADRDAFDWICEVETRADGMLIWAWKNVSPLNEKFDMVLKCFKVTNDGQFTEIASTHVGRWGTPLSGSAKAVAVSPDNTFFVVRDYYLKNSKTGPIAFTEVKVNINADMTEILNLPIVNHYANIDEVTLDYMQTNIHHWNDGLFESDWSDFDLDDNTVRMMTGQSIDYLSFVKGYSAYKVGELGSW